MLQLRQGIKHDGVVVVILHHVLQDHQIVGRELTDALVEGAGNLGVGLSLSVNDTLDVIFAFLHVDAELLQIA